MEHNPVLKNPLSLDSEIPLYSQLMGIIKRSITSGALKVGDLLPSEAELCRSYDISRNTVRQAIGALEEEGFVVRKRGKGTFVTDGNFPAGQNAVVHAGRLRGHHAFSQDRDAHGP